MGVWSRSAGRVAFTAGICLFSWTIGGASRAQSVGGIAGQVLDGTGGGVAGASVEVVGPTRRSASTDASGVYRIGGLAPGRYAVRVTKKRFVSFSRSDVAVAAGEMAVCDATLDLAPFEENVTVQDQQRLGLDAADSAGAIVLKEKDLESLPDDPDELAEALQALAGPAAGPEGGQIYIDGFSGGTLPPKSSIREIRINASPFSAEFDRMGWGRIEILTKPGSDSFRGAVAFRFNDESLNSRNPFAPNRPSFQRRDWDVNVGGPLSKKASFFIDTDRRDVDDNQLINARLLSASLTTAPYSLAVLTPMRHTSLGPRVDLQLGSRVTLTARYFFAQDDQPQSGIGEYSLLSRAYDSWSRRQSFQLSETAVLSKTVANETRVQYAWNRREQNGDSSTPTLSVLDAFTGGSSQVGHSYTNDRRIEIHNITSWTHGRHTLRGGVRVRGSWFDDVSQQNFGGTVTFAGGIGPELDANDQIVLDALGRPVTTQLSSLERYRRTLLFEQMGMSPAEVRMLGGGASQFQIAGGDPKTSISQWDFASFIQDDWRVSSSFTLSAGLRYENQSNISSNWNLAPRLAFAWAPKKSKGSQARTVVRGGFGVFYDRVSQDLFLTALRFDGSHQQQYFVTDPTVLDQMSFALDQVSGLPSVDALSTFKTPQAIRRVAANVQAPITYQSSLSFEQVLPGNFTGSVILMSTNGRRLLRSRNINAPLPETGERPLGTAETVYQYESTGKLNQTQLVFGLNNRLGRSFSVFARYFLGWAKSDTDGAGSFPASPYDLAAEYGPAGFDVRHRFTLGGSVLLPWEVRLSPFVIASSGQPFNITTGQDLNNDTIYADRPAYASDPSKPGVVATAFGLLDPDPSAGARIIPRNLGRGPAFFVFNLRVNKTIGLRPRKAATPAQPTSDAGPQGIPMVGGPGGGHGGGHEGGPRGPRGGGFGRHFGEDGGRGPTLSISISAQNLLNHVNAGPPVGNLSSPFFGQSTATAGGFGFGRRGGSSAAGNRRIDLQMRLSF